MICGTFRDEAAQFLTAVRILAAARILAAVLIMTEARIVTALEFYFRGFTAAEVSANLPVAVRHSARR